MISVSGKRPVNLETQSGPEIPGSWMSIRTTLGFRIGNRSNASSPVVHTATHSKRQDWRKSRCTPSEYTTSSSTMATVIGIGSISRLSLSFEQELKVRIYV